LWRADFDGRVVCGSCLCKIFCKSFVVRAIALHSSFASEDSSLSETQKPADSGDVVSACSEVFLKRDGSPYVKGDVMHRPRLADTLELIASDNGTWNMYNGSLAQSIVQDLQDIGQSSVLTLFI